MRFCHRAWTCKKMGICLRMEWVYPITRARNQYSPEDILPHLYLNFDFSGSASSNHFSIPSISPSASYFIFILSGRRVFLPVFSPYLHDVCHDTDVKHPGLASGMTHHKRRRNDPDAFISLTLNGPLIRKSQVVFMLSWIRQLLRSSSSTLTGAYYDCGRVRS